MTLTRTNNSEQYYSDTTSDGDRSILQTMDNVYAEAVTLNQSFWSEADIDTRFKAGDQTLWNDVYGNLPAFRRKQFSFNRIRRIVNMITGHQRKHRKSVVAVPIENADEVTASQITKALFWSFNKSHAQECISRAFDAGSITTGMSLINIWMDRTSDPISGDIRCDHVAYNGFLIDPYFKKTDLSDCNFIWRRQWLSKMALKGIIPDRDKEIDEMNSRGNRDGKFQFQAEAYNYAMYNLLSYDEYWYRDTRLQTIVVDLETGETAEWEGEDEELKIALYRNPTLRERKVIVPTTKLAIVVEGRVMYDGPNPLRIDRYPFIPFLGYYEPEIPYFPWRVQGVVRNLRDSQFLYNRRKIIELDILESQVNSGYKYKVDSLVNPKDIYLEGQGRGIAIKKSAEMTDVEKIIPADIPGGNLQISQILGQEMQEISGVSEELLGSADDDKAGILAMLRQGAALTTLEPLFDQLDNSVKLMGSIYMELIQKNFSVGKVQRIIGEKPAPLFSKKAFGKYDVAIEEGTNTTTQRQLKFTQLLHLHQVGLPITAKDLLEAATFQDKEKIIKNVEVAEKQQAEQQKMEMQLQMQMLQKQAEAMDSKSLADQGLGVERLSRVQENRALAIERIAEARKDQQLGALHMARAMKELEDMDTNQLEKLINLVMIVKEKMMSENTEGDMIMNETPVGVSQPNEGESSDAMQGVLSL